MSTFMPPQARAFTACPSTVLADVEVQTIVRMASRTELDRAELLTTCNSRVSSACILLMRHGLQVVRVTAEPVPAEVIEFQSGRHGTFDVLVHHTVCTSIFASVDHQLAISTGNASSSPYPTTCLGIDANPRHEPRQRLLIHQNTLPQESRTA